MSDIQIRELKSLYDVERATAIQRIYWGEEADSVIPAHMLYSIVNYGGHVFGAEQNGELIGTLIGFIGTLSHEDDNRPAMSNLVIASKRMVVLPEFRGLGIGYQLKLAQRERAIKQGIRLVSWTFDPLLAPNAHLNLRKLGALSIRFLPNYYGENVSGGLSTFGSSDRLKVDWWVTSRRVEERLFGQRGDLTVQQYFEGGATLVNPAIMGDYFIEPAENMNNIASTFGLVEIPLNFPEMVRKDEALARRWQLHIRETFITLFKAGFVITDFLQDEIDGRQRGLYLMSFDMGFDYGRR